MSETVNTRKMAEHVLDAIRQATDHRYPWCPDCKIIYVGSDRDTCRSCGGPLYQILPLDTPEKQNGQDQVGRAKAAQPGPGEKEPGGLPDQG